MKKRKCFFFIFNGYADWEPALAIASLNKYSDFSIHPFSIDGHIVESMGGLTIQPEKSLAEIIATEIDLLILPGGDAWTQGLNDAIAPLLEKLMRRKGAVAAICDATVFLAKYGYLDSTWHTSNGEQYLLQKISSYNGRHYYEDLPCVVDGNLITANGAGMVEFAIEILRHQKVMDEITIEKLYDLYKSGGVKNRLYQ